MEEYVNKVVELRAEISTEEAKADEASLLIDAEIEVVEAELKKLREDRTTARLPYVELAKEIQTTIDIILETLLEVWDGDTKTYKYPAGTVSYRTTGSLDIIDDIRLRDILIEKTCTEDIVSKYIKGFKLTEVKKFVDVCKVPTGVAVVKHKTSVSVKAV